MVWSAPDAGVVQRERSTPVLGNEARTGPRRLQLRARTMGSSPPKKSLEQQTASPRRRRPSCRCSSLVIEKLTANNQYVYIGMDHLAGPTTNWPWRSATSSSSAISRATALRAGSDILRVRHVRAFRRFPTPTGKTRRNCRAMAGRGRGMPAVVPLASARIS